MTPRAVEGRLKKRLFMRLDRGDIGCIRRWWSEYARILFDLESRMLTSRNLLFKISYNSFLLYLPNAGECHLHWEIVIKFCGITRHDQKHSSGAHDCHLPIPLHFPHDYGECPTRVQTLPGLTSGPVGLATLELLTGRHRHVRQCAFDQTLYSFIARKTNTTTYTLTPISSQVSGPSATKVRVRDDDSLSEHTA